MVTILALTLLAGWAMAAAAQGDQAVFEWSLTPNDDGWGATIEAEDSRASGALTLGIGEALVTDELTLASVSFRLVNDEGAWVGTGRSVSGDLERGQGVDIWEMTGEEAYQGLSLFLFGGQGDDGSWGVIVSTDAIPPYPEVPTE